MNELLDAALEYRENGFSVIPVKPGGKTPLIKWEQYQKQAAGADQIETWWRQWPDANIGLVTGAVSGVDAVDIDTAEGFQTLSEHLPDDFDCPKAQSPRGGWHLYVQSTGEGNKTAFLPGVDYRGTGGFIVAPPSRGGPGAYKWIHSILDIQTPPLPASIYKYISLYRGVVVTGPENDNIRQHLTTNDNSDNTDNKSFFSQGRRDEDLFHAANCLIKGGADSRFASQVLNMLAKICEPPFSQKEAAKKIESALSRAGHRDRNLTQEIREWVLTTNGNFSTTDVNIGQQVTTREERKVVAVILRRLAQEGLIEKYGDKNGVYRRVETDVEAVDFLNAPTDEFPITWPMGIEDLAVIYPGNIIVVAGSKSSGKTGFLLNVVKENMHKHDVVYLNSEMGDTEFRKRLELFGHPELSNWKFKAYHRAGNFADLITGEKKIFIVDFLEVSTDFWRVAGMIQEIHKKLRDGICIIALQKADHKDTGRGGDFSREKSRLYLSLDYMPENKVNRLKITDAKTWRTSINPRGMHRFYKLVQGCRFVPTSDWTE